MSTLNETSITFGKYKDQPLTWLLRDRKYCQWLQEQEWFQSNYSFLFQLLKQYNPKAAFYNLSHIDPNVLNTSLETLEHFHLQPLLSLSQDVLQYMRKEEHLCYEYYVKCVEKLHDQIKQNIQNAAANPFDIVAPNKWLKDFEKSCQLPRTIMKEFLEAFELPNLCLIVESIKKLGGLEYKGAKAFKIAKENSLKQENFWETVLKKVYKDELGCQFKFKNCFFDFIHIQSCTLFECKMRLKDFNQSQFLKYLETLTNFRLLYLIGNDCIIDLKRQIVYSLHADQYSKEVEKLSTKHPDHSFFSMIATYTFVQLDNLEEYFEEN
jgi:hypothetical protein